MNGELYEPHRIAACMQALAHGISTGILSNSCAAEALKELAADVLYLRAAPGPEAYDLADVLIDRFLRRQQIDLDEPTIEDAIKLLAAMEREDQREAAEKENEQ